MIIQSSNDPIKMIFDEEKFGEKISSIPTIRVTLWQNDEILKLWEKEDLQIEDNVAIAPLTQEETASFEIGPCVLEIKGLDETGKTWFAKQVSLMVTDRNDKEEMTDALH